ncbi:hypothetical protein GOODEAATRI_025072 [Goodea atripinnis]|uniref:ribonuclease H n=1 Tax=Goodea atripinnis TaxID=208336 RepID=A0ABV0NXX2_9TELE
MDPLPGSNGVPVGSSGRIPAAEGASVRLLTHHEGRVPQGSGLLPVPILEPSLTACSGTGWPGTSDIGQCPSSPLIRSHPSSLIASFSVPATPFQYNRLPFGYSLTPCMFSTCMEMAIQPLRTAGMKLLFYLDDLFDLVQRGSNGADEGAGRTSDSPGVFP